MKLSRGNFQKSENVHLELIEGKVDMQLLKPYRVDINKRRLAPLRVMENSLTAQANQSVDKVLLFHTENVHLVHETLENLLAFETSHKDLNRPLNQVIPILLSSCYGHLNRPFSLAHLVNVRDLTTGKASFVGWYIIIGNTLGQRPFSGSLD